VHCRGPTRRRLTSERKAISSASRAASRSSWAAAQRVPAGAGGSPAIARKVLENHKPGRVIVGAVALTESAERIGSAQRAELDILRDFLRIAAFEASAGAAERSLNGFVTTRRAPSA